MIKNRIILWGAILALLLTGCASTPISENEAIDSFFTVSANLYRGSHPGSSGIIALRSLGVRTILSLEENSQVFREEKALASMTPMTISNLPISLYKLPTDEQIVNFMNIVLDPINQPVYVHCDNGKDRTGVMIALYRVLWEGMPTVKAYEEAKKYGLGPYISEVELKEFLHQLTTQKSYLEYVDRYR